MSGSETVAESRVGEIVNSLSLLEDDIDSLDAKVGDMKRNIIAKTQSEIDALLVETKKLAAKDAEIVINKAKEAATVEAAQVTTQGESKVSDMHSKINTNFDSAVKDVVSFMLKA